MNEHLPSLKAGMDLRWLRDNLANLERRLAATS